MRDLGMRLLQECSRFDRRINGTCSQVAYNLITDSNDTISRNLGSDYLTFINTTNDNQPGQNVRIDRLLVIWGQNPHTTFERNSDGVVTREDAEGILATVNATTKTINRIDGVNHEELVRDLRTENLIRGILHG